MPQAGLGGKFAASWQRGPCRGKLGSTSKAGEIPMAKGLLFAAFDFGTVHEDEFHDWYDLEHVPERLRVPGFLNAERWIAEDNPVIHVATYDLTNPAVLSSAPYKAVAGANQ